MYDEVCQGGTPPEHFVTKDGVVGGFVRLPDGTGFKLIIVRQANLRRT